MSSSGQEGARGYVSQLAHCFVLEQMAAESLHLLNLQLTNCPDLWTRPVLLAPRLAHHQLATGPGVQRRESPVCGCLLPASQTPRPQNRSLLLAHL